eukprot:1887794-Alexandrium_andersonii.AAC.1
MHARTNARTHTRAHARAHTRTHARTHSKRVARRPCDSGEPPWARVGLRTAGALERTCAATNGPWRATSASASANEGLW